MPLNPNILALLRQGMTGNAQSNAPQGIDPNLEMILQGMGMMPRRLDMQGRPIVGGVENPSNMDQHYARQGNTEAMRRRYSSPTFAMGPNDPNRMTPATSLPPQGAITARQPVTGLPGQVGPAYGMTQTPINMFPSPEEGDAMDMVRKQYRQTMRQGSATPAAMPQQAAPAALPAWQGPPAPAEWQGPPAPAPAPSIASGAMDSWMGQMPSNQSRSIAGMADLSGIRPLAPGVPTTNMTLPPRPGTPDYFRSLERQNPQMYPPTYRRIRR